MATILRPSTISAAEFVGTGDTGATVVVADEAVGVVVDRLVAVGPIACFDDAPHASRADTAAIAVRSAALVLEILRRVVTFRSIRLRRPRPRLGDDDNARDAPRPTGTKARASPAGGPSR